MNKDVFMQLNKICKSKTTNYSVQEKMHIMYQAIRLYIQKKKITGTL